MRYFSAAVFPTGTWTEEYYFSLSYTWLYTESATFTESGRVEFERVDELGISSAYSGSWDMQNGLLSIKRDSCSGREESGALVPIPCDSWNNRSEELSYDAGGLYTKNESNGLHRYYRKK